MASAKIATTDARKLMVVFCLMLLVEVPMRLVPFHGGFSQLLLLGASRVIEAVLIIKIAFAGENGFSAGGVISGFRRGFLWSAGFGGIALLGFIFFLVMGIDPLPFIKTPLPTKTGDLIPFFLVGGIISPVAEELFFRGVVYGFLRRWGVVVAVMMSSLLFVLAHMDLKGFFFIQLTGGIVFAVAYEVEKNLVVPITMHILGNLAIFSISLLQLTPNL